MALSEDLSAARNCCCDVQLLESLSMPGSVLAGRLGADIFDRFDYCHEKENGMTSLHTNLYGDVSRAPSSSYG